jgi:3-(3-hydroxy-phenyl)propionate hydroxylase
MLEGTVRGPAAEALLDSYGAERQAHVRALTSRLKSVGAVICERDPDKARERDAHMLAECGGTVKDTPRQDILPRLEAGLLSAHDSTARGTLFPQPWLLSGGQARHMDEIHGNGWRLVLAASVGSGVTPSYAGVRVVPLADACEADGALADWFSRHACMAALVRPDNYVYGSAAAPDGIGALVAQAAHALGWSVQAWGSSMPFLENSDA